MLWTGSRGWQDEDTVIDAVTSLRRPFRSIVGDARGFDSIVWDVLSGFLLPRWRFDAQWKLYGKPAGHRRNHLMIATLRRVDPGGLVIAGWDGQSSGTKGCMDAATKRGVPVWELQYVPSINQEV